MAKTKNNKQVSGRAQHIFRGIREPLINNPTDKTVYNLTTGTNGQTSFALALSPLGVKSVKLTGTVFANAVIDAPHMSWLYNTAGTFGSYRILRLRLVFVGNAGSTTSGTLNLFGSGDPQDCGVGINTAFMQGPGSRSFDLASSSHKELSLNVPVDTSWKKVATSIATVGGTLPWFNDASTIVVINSVADLCFGGIAAQVVGGPASVNVGNLFVEYDVEFKNPMSLSMNA